MHFILAAGEKRDPRKYRWLEYVGRRAVLDVMGSDKQEYDIELSKGEKFGVKKFRGSVFILDSTNLAVQFKLTPEDAKRLIGNAKGYSGKVGRYKVLPFDGGKDKANMGKNRTDEHGRLKLIVDSSVFQSGMYDKENQRIIVQFKNGAIWQYADVSAKEVKSFERAASQGRWFNRNLKGVKESTRLSKFPIGVSTSSTANEYKGKSVSLEKPFRMPKGSKKKFGVYVKSEAGNVIRVVFGDPNMSIKRDDPARRKSFMARHKCDTKNDKTTPGYWSCKAWELSTNWV